jgi:putative tricarboxylic transport membrane protein
MSDTSSQALAKSIAPKLVKGPQDFYGGLVLVGTALFTLWTSSDLPGMRDFSFGPGTTPRMFAYLLLALGGGVAIMGLLAEGPPLQRFGIRGPFFVTLSILTFAVAIRPLGLIVSAFVAFMIAALGTHETRWKEAVIVGIVLTIGCALLFPYGLGLPLDLFPRILR